MDGGQDWSEVVRRSTVHPAVFAVRDPALAADVVAWARDAGLPHRHADYAFSAELDGWALLDGGPTRLHARSSGRLRSGLRVVGWAALRLLVAELGLVPPRRPLVGEGQVRPDGELRELAARRLVSVTPAERQARLLVSYVDARGLARVADTLAGRLPDRGDRADRPERPEAAQLPRTSWANRVTSARSSSASPTSPAPAAGPPARPAG